MALSTGAVAAIGTAALGPVGGAVATVGDALASLFPGGGPTKDTQVARFQQDLTSGNTADAGALIDQAAYHGFIQTGITDKDVWQGIFAGLYNVADTVHRNYMLGLLRGAPLQYQFIGQPLDQTQIPQQVKTLAATNATAPVSLPGATQTTLTAQPSVSTAGVASSTSSLVGVVLLVFLVVVGVVLAKKGGK